MIFKDNKRVDETFRAITKHSFLLILFLLVYCITTETFAQTLISKQVFDYTGTDQQLTIPSCISFIKVKMWGGGGGGSQYNGQNAGGGAGAYVEGKIAVSPGDIFTIMAGEGGACDGTADNASYGFGGAPYSSDQYGGYGGGLSGIFTNNTPVTAADFTRALLIAGGGGGAERASQDTYCTSGGQGGDAVFGGGMPDMKGDESAPGIGGGGGGGYRGGLKTLRLSGNGIWYAGEGGLNYIDPSVTNAVNLSSADFGNWNAFPATYKEPPNTTDPDYTAFVSSASPGIGTGSMFTYSRAGHGRVVVEFYSNPITASNDTLICEGNAAILSVSGGTTYMWNTGATTASISVNPVSLATYTVTETATGCIDSVTVNVNPKPVVTLNADSICPGQTAVLNANGAAAYVWSNSSTSSSISVTPAVSSAYTVIGTLNGCSDTTTATVIVFVPPAVDAGLNDSVCAGMSASLIVTPNGAGYAYSWLSTTGLNNPAVFNPVASPAATATYTVTVTDQNSCSSTDSVTVFVDPALSATQSVTDVTCHSLCNGQATVTVNGGTSPYSYSWTGACTTAICGSLCAGTYSVTITDAFGCSIISDTLITEPDTLIAAITTSSAATCNDSCNGTAAAIAIGGTQGSAYTFSWSTAPVQSTATAMGLCAGTYTCTVTDANNCASTTTATIVEPAPIALAINTTPTACSSNTGIASVIATGGTAGYTYSWSPGGQTASVATGLTSGSYTITVADTNGCQAMQTAIITVADNPVATASASAYTIFEGSSVKLTASGGTGFQWLPATALICDTCQVTAASLVLTTMYCVTVTDTNACTDTACVTILVEKPCPGDYIVPTAFSPNSDGFNDRFCLQGWDNCVSEFSILIFDRWGEKVFESNNPGFCWDGTCKSAFGAGAGSDMNSAVFVFVVEAVLSEGTEISRKGNITLVR